MTDGVLVSSSFLPGRGGIETYLAELCDRLAPRLAVLAPVRRDKLPIPDDLPYPTEGYPGSMLVPTKRIAEAIDRAARRHGTNKILFGTPWPLVLLGPRLKNAGLRYSVIVHGAEMLIPSALPAVRTRLARALADADLLFPVSRYTAGTLATFISRRGHLVPHLEVLRAVVDLDRFTPAADAASVRRRLDVSDSAPLILAFGRLVKRKGVHRLVRIMPKLRRAVPGTVLVVAGTGPELLPLKRLAHRKRSAVVFAGRVPDEEAPGLFAAADVFALPVADRWFGLEIEGLGVVLLEAAATETACLTGRSGGTPEAVIDGLTGYVVDARSETDLLAKLVAMLTDREKTAEMGRAGRRHVAEHFSGKEVPRTLVDWLEEGSDVRTGRPDH